MQTICFARPCALVVSWQSGMAERHGEHGGHVLRAATGPHMCVGVCVCVCVHVCLCVCGCVCVCVWVCHLTALPWLEKYALLSYRSVAPTHNMLPVCTHAHTHTHTEQGFRARCIRHRSSYNQGIDWSVRRRSKCVCVCLCLCVYECESYTYRDHAGCVRVLQAVQFRKVKIFVTGCR